jgi:rhodanese-related sulfurtransferase
MGPFCQEGLRSYLACRILKHAGLSCRSLTGGYKTYRAVQAVRLRHRLSNSG